MVEGMGGEGRGEGVQCVMILVLQVPSWLNWTKMRATSRNSTL